MIKIIEEGQKEFTARCPICGCKFSYQLRDIELTSVRCPCCDHYVVHKINKPKESSLNEPCEGCPWQRHDMQDWSPFTYTTVACKATCSNKIDPTIAIVDAETRKL